MDMKQPSRGAKARPTPATVKLRLGEAGLDLPDDYLDGIVRNLIVLQDHAATLDPFDYSTADLPHE